jgi:polyferredoxin
VVSKHFLWLMIAWWTGGAWVLYFADAPTLVKDLATGQAPLIAYGWIGILTFTTYTLAGHMREQVCTYMCPWPRIQAALTDEYALNVTYRYDRGEPRTSSRRARSCAPRARRPATASIATSASRSARPASTSATARSSNASNADCASTPATT